jgi:translation elongation factor EF-1alpha
MEEEVGKITHYFSKIQVGVIKVEKGVLRVGDVIRIKGHTTDFIQKVDSLQMEHAPVEQIKAGDSAGFKVEGPVREHDVVFKVIED